MGGFGVIPPFTGQQIVPGIGLFFLFFIERSGEYDVVLRGHVDDGIHGIFGGRAFLERGGCVSLTGVVEKVRANAQLLEKIFVDGLEGVAVDGWGR